MDIMLDLETMGTDSNAAIISIGAIAMDMEKNEVQEDTLFYYSVSLESSVKYGGTINPSTIMWWLKQSEEARQAVASNKSRPIINVLEDFNDWFLRYDFKCVWGNGVDFDNVILSNALSRASISCPWSFRNNRCYRTINALYGADINISTQRVVHRALDDAIYQAKRLMEIRKHMAIGL